MQFDEASTVQIIFGSRQKYFGNSRSLCVAYDEISILFTQVYKTVPIAMGLSLDMFVFFVHVSVCYVRDHRSFLSESENKNVKSFVDCGIFTRVSSLRKLYSVPLPTF